MGEDGAEEVKARWKILLFTICAVHNFQSFLR
jgi:hypothetical protein